MSPNNPTRKRHHPFDAKAYKRRNLVELIFCKLRDFRRVATRYDKLATNYAAAVQLAAIMIWWLSVRSLALRAGPYRLAVGRLGRLAATAIIICRIANVSYVIKSS